MDTHAAATEIHKEIRFAVVMYGGVSLAIYINGVAQELFALSRATATHSGDHPASGTDRTYRRVAQLLSLHGDALDQVERRIDDNAPAFDDALLPSADVHVKFVIDTLSGTSAGGINAVFLGKALVNDQRMTDLQRIWIEEADLLKLINDKRSTHDLRGLKYQREPAALLNGQRLYLKLVDALDRMDHAASAAPSSHVDELDVFLTATDVNGTATALQLADGVVTERRYKNVFQFRYRRDGGAVEHTDFDRTANPILAFAARCTSAFPFAFEPMRLEDIGEVLRCMSGHEDERDLGRDAERWRRYFPRYDSKSPTGFWERPFADGGYLDNKPFGHAIDMLGSRPGGLPSERKVIYIEPDPEHAADAAESPSLPTALENLYRSQTIAGYETIREDLERILTRNRLVERVQRLLDGCDEDIPGWHQGKSFNDEKLFLESDLPGMIGIYGPAYGGYHRLKVGALTDEIGDWLAASFNHEPNSAYVTALRLLVRQWRHSRYAARHADVSLQTENRFLYEFDLAYRVRRLRYVLQRLEEVRAFKDPERDEARVKAWRNLFTKLGIDCPSSEVAFADAAMWNTLDLIVAELGRALRVLLCGRDALRRLARECPHHALCPVDDESRPQHSPHLHAELLRAAGLTFIRAELSAADGESRDAGPLETVAWQSHPLTRFCDPAVLTPALFAEILRGRSHEERVARADQALVEHGLAETLDEMAEFLRSYVSRYSAWASKTSRGVLDGLIAREAGWSLAIAQLAKDLYENYQGYDFASFPVMYATDVGDELATTEVIRISPDDATSLIDTKHDPGRKLAGTRLMHFGAFLDREWRRNDMLWGRLDGAERLITSIVPQRCPKLARVLVREAHCQILQEHFAALDSQTMMELLAKSLGPVEDFKADRRKRLPASASDAPFDLADRDRLLDRLIREGRDPRQVLEMFSRSDAYRFDPEPSPRTVAEALTRGATVVGKVLERVSEKASMDMPQKATRWLIWVGRVTWTLVEASTPKSWRCMMMRDFVGLGLLIPLVLVFLGIIFDKSGTRDLGWLTLACAVAIWTAWLWLRARLSGTKKARTKQASWVKGVRRFAAGVIAICVMLLATIGAIALSLDRTQLTAQISNLASSLLD